LTLLGVWGWRLLWRAILPLAMLPRGLLWGMSLWLLSRIMRIVLWQTLLLLE